ncbi:MAG: hypothetical protein ACRDNK_11845 [Solirubrobacteraceae bacterium]
MSDRSDLIADDDPVKAERARRLLRSAAKAVDEFEDAIRELVEMRAWTVLGYDNLADMWEKENGFKCPSYAKVLAVEAMSSEGMNTRVGNSFKRLGPNGHSTATIADQVGMSKSVRLNGHTASSAQVGSIMRQLDHGVPANKIMTTAHSGRIRENIVNNGTQELHTRRSHARPIPRRHGKSASELVSVSVNVLKRYDVAMGEVARKADVPKAEIYRQAVTEYLDRHGISAFYGQADAESEVAL